MDDWSHSYIWHFYARYNKLIGSSGSSIELMSDNIDKQLKDLVSNIIHVVVPFLIDLSSPKTLKEILPDYFPHNKVFLQNVSIHELNLFINQSDLA